MNSTSTLVAAAALCLSTLKRQRHVALQLILKVRNIRRQRLRLQRKLREQLRPGYGVSFAGFKRTYKTNRLTSRYDRVCGDETWFNASVHMSPSDFSALHAIVAKEINSPLDPYNQFTPAQRAQKRRKRKKLSSQELLFLYLEMLSGGICGAEAIMNMSEKVGVSGGSIWNYIYHTGWACFRALSATEPITWPDASERRAMCGLIKGFPDTVMFVDGTRQPIFKSTDEDTQNDQYFGKDKRHCYAVLIYVDVYGEIRRVEVSYSGRIHDKTMFERSDVYLKRSIYFSDNEKMICDAGFIGAGDPDWVITPFKKGTALFFELRNEWNKDVRQRFRNEVSIGYVKNRNRAFMGCWPYAEELFTASIMNAAMMMNWKLRRNGKQIVPLERCLEKLSDVERVMFITQ